MKATRYVDVDKTLAMMDERIAQRIDQIPDEELSPEVLNNLIAELKLDGRDYGQNVRLFKKAHWSLGERIGKFYPPVIETINTENELNALVDKMGKYAAQAVMYLLYRAARRLYSPLIDACDSVNALRAVRRRIEDKVYIAGIEGKISGQTHRIYDSLIRQQQDIESLRQFKTGLDSVEQEILDDFLTVQLITIMQPRIDAAANSSEVESLYKALQKEERNILERYIYGKIRSFWQEPVELSESFQELTKLNLQLSAFESPVVKGLFQAKAQKTVEHYTQEAVSFEEFLQQEREFEQSIDLIGDSPVYKGGSGCPAGSAEHYYFQPQLMQKRQELFKEYLERNSRDYADLDRFIGSLPVLTRVSLNEQIKEARISLLRGEASRCDSLTHYEQIGRWMDEIGLGSSIIYWQGNPLYDLMSEYHLARERITA
ncbi:MAG: hypothetical protein EPN88_11355 [Bacteroidetes bacterium]|nr:MAG: hypothetical protein EPN88_11355 [Bacteroidota bacterium]